MTRHVGSPSLLIISPVKDEEQFLERTIRTIESQTLRPTRWIIVDDASSDRTGEIADAAALRHDWISVLHRGGSHGRRVGPGVVEAFYAGLALADLSQYRFLCKLDGDIELQPRYFEDMIRRFESNPRLGTASGKTYIPVDGRFVKERSGDEFSHGVAKLYRRECFEEIGGFVHEVMWDGIDCHRCRMLGWEAVSFDDPELAILHLRQMGSSFKSVYHGRLRWGRGQYFMGTHPLYLLGISGYRMFERPWVLGGLCILGGYVDSWLHRRRQYDEPGFREHLHRWQLAELRRRLTGRSVGSSRTASTPRPHIMQGHASASHERDDV
ncbi:MAG: glycosyltransferase family A protein [Isosphaeraceae bacterium]|nr:glycosyltransferase family A protein [Isosphaeraceae bacterium]